MASAKAIKAFKDGGFDKAGGRIGIVLNLTPSYPRSKEKKDVEAADFVDLFFNRMFLDTAVKGKFPEKLVEILKVNSVLWDYAEEELALISENTIDYLGINYYQPKRIKAKEEIFDNSKGWLPDKHFDNYIMSGRRMNPYRGWEIYPKAMYDIAINIKQNYNNIPWYISENGMGVEGEEKFMNKDGMV